MKLIKVTDTKGKVWYLNPRWIQRISEYGNQTDIEFAIKLRGIIEPFEYHPGLRVKESVEQVKNLLEISLD